MSFNRLRYDYDEQKLYEQESAAPGKYWLGTPVTCQSCFQPNPEFRSQKSGVSMQGGTPWRFYAGPVDVESDLMNLNRIASKVPKRKYKPECKNCSCDNQGQPCGQGVVTGCVCHKGEALRKKGQRCPDNDLVDFQECFLPNSNTRLSNPPSTLKGTGVNRFNPLCLDPQVGVISPINQQNISQLVFRDNHRPLIPDTSVISRPLVEMNEDPVPGPKICGIKTPFTGYMKQYDRCG